MFFEIKLVLQSLSLCLLVITLFLLPWEIRNTERGKALFGLSLKESVFVGILNETFTSIVPFLENACKTYCAIFFPITATVHVYTGSIITCELIILTSSQHQAYCLFSRAWSFGLKTNILCYDSFSDKVVCEITQCEKNPNPYILGTSLPYS